MCRVPEIGVTTRVNHYTLSHPGCPRVDCICSVSLNLVLSLYPSVKILNIGVELLRFWLVYPQRKIWRVYL